MKTQYIKTYEMQQKQFTAKRLRKKKNLKLKT